MSPNYEPSLPRSNLRIVRVTIVLVLPVHPTYLHVLAGLSFVLGDVARVIVSNTFLPRIACSSLPVLKTALASPEPAEVLGVARYHRRVGRCGAHIAVGRAAVRSGRVIAVAHRRESNRTECRSWNGQLRLCASSLCRSWYMKRGMRTLSSRLEVLWVLFRFSR
jgi:hypothetical protein